MEIRWISSGKFSQEPKHWIFSTKIQADLQGKNIRPEKKSVIEESSCQCSMTLNWKGRFLCSYLKEDQRICLKIQRWTLGILGTWRRKRVVSRICSRIWWQVGSSCVTNGGHVRESRTSGIPGSKPAGPWNSQEEKQSRNHTLQWGIRQY